MAKSKGDNKATPGFIPADLRILGGKVNRTVKIVIQGGVLREVENLPEGWDYELFDLDECEEQGSCGRKDCPRCADRGCGSCEADDHKNCTNPQGEHCCCGD